MLRVEFDDSAIRKELGILAKAVGVNVRLVYYDQMRLWLNDLIKRTPPKSNPQGKKAVKRDIEKLFLGMRDRNVLEYFDDDFQKKGKLDGGTIINRNGNPSRIEAWHEKNRTRRGNVRRSTRTTRDFGNGLSFVNKMYVPVQSIRRYIKKKQSHVGTLKAGWVKAAVKFSRLSGGAAKIPGFVMKQARKLGGFVLGMKETGSGDLVAINKVPFASDNRHMMQMVDFTQKVRQKDITKHAAKRIDQLVERFNTGKLAA